MLDEDFSVSVHHGDGYAYITCAGELDVATSQRLRQSVEVVLRQNPSRLRFDGMGISFLATAGVTVLIDVLMACHDQGIPVEVILSDRCRRVLVRLGLWWVGVIDDGASVDLSLREGLRSYVMEAVEEMRQTPHG